jgi:hypothetical protein
MHTSNGRVLQKWALYDTISLLQKNMAITKSAKKAIRQSATRKAHNIVYKNKIKVLVKEARSLVLAKKLTEAKNSFK